MIAEALFASLAARGVILDIDGSRIGVTPWSATTDAERASIRACKVELINLLTNPEALARVIARFCENGRIDLADFLDRNPALRTALEPRD